MWRGVISVVVKIKFQQLFNKLHFDKDIQCVRIKSFVKMGLRSQAEIVRVGNTECLCELNCLAWFFLLAAEPVIS